MLVRTLTVPVGAPLALPPAVFDTVTVQVDFAPVFTVPGEHATFVEVGLACRDRVAVAELGLYPMSPR